MSEITITREHMIEAIRNEPLVGNRWTWLNFDVTSDPEISVVAPGVELKKEYEPSECPVCAVGGTLRQAGVREEFIESVADDNVMVGLPVTDDIEEEIARLVQDGEYLSALSCFFEKGYWKTREDIIDWVERNVPEDYEEIIEEV